MWPLDPMGQKRRITHKRPSPPDEEMEEELAQKPFEPINTAVSIFDHGLEHRFGGINTTPSIFDRGATFHTHETKKESP